ncbi:aminoacyltransferase [Streptococcus cameli]
MYTYQTGISAYDHDEFVKNHPQVNLLQSSSWATIKDSWGNERVGFYQDGQLCAVASILIQPLPLGFTMMYIPRGPVMDYADTELVAFVIASLKKIAKKHSAVFIKFDPSIILRQYALADAQTATEDTTVLNFIENLKQAGAIWSGRTSDMADTIQPRYQAKVFTSENVLSNFPKHTQRLMKDAINRGVVTTRGSIEELPEFASIIALTENRKGVALRNEDYFKKIMTVYGKDAYLHLAKVHLSNRLEEYKEQLLQITKELDETAPHQKKRLTKLSQQKASVEKYITEFTGFVEKYDDELVIAGILSIKFGNSMEMLYAGMNDEFKKFYPQYSLYPKVFTDAYEDGIVWANMGGVEGSLEDGLTKFKANFAPAFEEYMGEFDIPANPILYRLSIFAYNLRKKLRNKH